MRRFFLAAMTSIAAFSATTQAAETYEAAYKSTQATGKPLVVLIGADWCPACQTMKRSVMPQMQSAGKLNDVAFATVNIDQQGKIGQAMMEGNLIPQLVKYTKTADGWKLDRLIGGQSPEAVEKFLARSTKGTPAVETVGQRGQ